MRYGLQLGGGRVTWFPFSPLDIFIYISHWATQVNSQKEAAFWRWLSELMVKACASWCNSTGCKSKKPDKILMQNWNVILSNLVSFFDWVAPTKRFFYCCYWDPMPDRRVSWGSLQWAGINLLWLLCLNIDWDCLSYNGLGAHVTCRNFYHFHRPLTDPLHSPNGLSLGLCKETVKECRHHT